jgi:hypothetical protein
MSRALCRRQCPVVDAETSPITVIEWEEDHGLVVDR